MMIDKDCLDGWQVYLARFGKLLPRTETRITTRGRGLSVRPTRPTNFQLGAALETPALLTHY